MFAFPRPPRLSPRRAWPSPFGKEILVFLTRPQPQSWARKGNKKKPFAGRRFFFCLSSPSPGLALFFLSFFLPFFLSFFLSSFLSFFLPFFLSFFLSRSWLLNRRWARKGKTKNSGIVFVFCLSSPWLLKRLSSPGPFGNKIIIFLTKRAGRGKALQEVKRHKSFFFLPLLALRGSARGGPGPAHLVRKSSFSLPDGSPRAGRGKAKKQKPLAGRRFFFVCLSSPSAAQPAAGLAQPIW